MLFALEWIQNTYQSVTDAMQRFIGGVTFSAIEQALTAQLWVLIPAAVMGLALCLYGFKLHKLVSGLAGGALLGWLGWYLGLIMNPELITVPILYTFILAIAGFSLTYIVYVLNVFTASFLVAWASCAAFPGLPAGYRLPIAIVFAVVYCVLYVRRKEAMTPLTGAMLMGFITAGLWSALIGAAVCSVFTAAGILMQAVLKQRSDDKKSAMAAEEKEKYPFGPGERDRMRAALLSEGKIHSPAALNAPGQSKGERA